MMIRILILDAWMVGLKRCHFWFPFVGRTANWIAGFDSVRRHFRDCTLSFSRRYQWTTGQTPQMRSKWTNLDAAIAFFAPFCLDLWCDEILWVFLDDPIRSPCQCLLRQHFNYISHLCINVNALSTFWMSTKQERAGKGDKWIQTCWEVMAGRRPRVLALLSILLGVWLGLSWSQSLWRADFNHKLVVKHAVHIHWLLHMLLLLLCSFLPWKGSSLATQMLAIGFQHELFQLRLFQWFLGISKVCGLRQLCLQANVCLTVVSRLWPSFLTSVIIRHLINGEKNFLRTLGSVTQSDQLGSERLAMNCVQTCLKS